MNEIKKINEQIEVNNELFKSTSESEKRVMIVKDVLVQIKNNRYIATPGTWVRPHWHYDNREQPVYDGSMSIQKLFSDKLLKSCEVCALGGIFMSCINLNNNTTKDVFYDETDDLGGCIEKEKPLSNGLNQFFSKHQLKLIEQYFEGTRSYFLINIDHHFNIEGFCKKYPDSTERLIVIMENIIKNAGIFLPENYKTNE